jgi:LPXTG-motif cell wall-anchored protein
VAPFTGLIHLGPWRALVPIALASALWYGGIILAAAKLGENWESVMGWVNQFNKVVGIGLLVLLAIGAFLWWRRRKRAAP